MSADTVYVESRCDSLEALVVDYERRIGASADAKRDMQEQRDTAEIKPKGGFSLRWLCIGFGAGIAAAAVAAAASKLRKLFS